MTVFAIIYNNHSLNMVMSRDPGFKFGKFLFLPNSLLNFRKNLSKWAKSQNGPRIKMGQRSKWANGQNGPRIKMDQVSKWTKSQNGLRVEMGCLPPERVELTVNSNLLIPAVPNDQSDSR